MPSESVLMQIADTDNHRALWVERRSSGRRTDEEENLGSSRRSFGKATAVARRWARWRPGLSFPSLGLTLVAGLIAIALNPRFHNAGWAWVKLATGILIFEGGFVSVLDLCSKERQMSARSRILVDPATLAAPLAGVRNTVCILLAVAMANVILGI